MLVMLLVIFGLEFFIHYSIDAHWEITLLSSFRLFAMIITGIIIGISTGRNITYYYKYLYAKSESLKENVNIHF